MANRLLTARLGGKMVAEENSKAISGLGIGKGPPIPKPLKEHAGKLVGVFFQQKVYRIEKEYAEWFGMVYLDFKPSK